MLLNDSHVPAIQQSRVWLVRVPRILAAVKYIVVECGNTRPPSGFGQILIPMKASKEAWRGDFEPSLLTEHKKKDRNALRFMFIIWRGAAIGIERWVFRGANLAFVIPANSRWNSNRWAVHA
jgi:hypothetical protein